MGNVKAGSLAAEVMKRRGVRYIFGIPGGHVYPLMEGCAQRGIEFIGVRHEMTAAFAAEGWALTTGQPGVATGTAGPGVTNMFTGMANASSGGYPVVYFGGRARVSEFDRNELQDFDQIPVTSELCKYARAVADPVRLPEYVDQTFAHATVGRPGPAYVEMPRDLMESVVDEDSVPVPGVVTVAGGGADPAGIEAAADMIRQAQRPLMIIGAGAWWSQAQDELTAFVEQTGIPFFTRNAGRGIIPDAHPLFAGIGYNHPILVNALQSADLAIVVGTRPGFTLSRKVFPAGLKIIRIDIDAAEVTNQLDVTLPLVGDVKHVVSQLSDALAARPADPQMAAAVAGWVQQLKAGAAQMVQQFGAAMQSDASPIHPMRLMAEIARRVDKDTIVVLDGGDVATWGVLTLPAAGPGQLLGIAHNSFGPLGVGMGYAIAAKLAHPDKKVIHLTGDGAFGYGAMEYDTCMRYGLDITTIILNDAEWGMIKRSEAKKSSGHEFVGLDLRETHYEKVVEALGGHGEFVVSASDIGPAIDRALASGKPSCVNVMTDPQYGPPLG